MRCRIPGKGIQIVLVTVFALGLMKTNLPAQDQGTELRELKKEMREFRQALAEKQKKIDALEKQVKELQVSKAAAQAPQAQIQPGVPNAQTAAADVQQQVQELKEQVEGVAEAQKKEVPSVFNPAIGLVGETVFSYRSAGSRATGSDRPGGWDVNQRSVELNVSASVDPFAKGYAVFNASADPITGEANVGVEEAAVVTTSLPWNLTLQAGRFFGEFGRLAYIHDHELPFVNRPLVLDRYIGGESRTDGMQVNYLFPVSHYVSLTMGVGDGFGVNPNDINDINNGDFRNFGGLSFWGRASSSFDLTPNVSLETGISGMGNPDVLDRGGVLALPDGTSVSLPEFPGSTLKERERTVFGVDFALSWKPLQNNQFQSFTWGTEFLHSDNNYDVIPAGDNPLFSRSVESNGLYSYLAYKFSREWTAGFLFDWMEAPENSAAMTFAYSPYLTWSLSHWSQLRLQYTHTENNAATGLRPDDAVYLQWSWIIGSHSHGWQQR